MYLEDYKQNNLSSAMLFFSNACLSLRRLVPMERCIVSSCKQGGFREALSAWIDPHNYFYFYY
jgi:hypothetical protein